jgi:rare lipoprotein A (peptidoglycan hydrolase)
MLVSGAIPSIGAAASGGAGLTTNSPSGATGLANVAPGNVTVTAEGNGMTLTSHASALLRNSLSFSGNVPSSSAGQTIVIQRLGHETGWTWTATATATANKDGSFSAVWQTDHIGRFSIRVLVEGGAQAAAASPTLTVTVYRPSISTLYGPGFWGQRTACGEKLTRSTLGVANKTLACGTQVALYYHGRTLIVPVIDRGPYANHADWDLTMATGRALGIPGTATIGAVSLPVAPPH